MALATTCPQCKVSFKVVPDQLKLRRGLVRCGACQHVFSGIDFLRYVDDARPRADAPDRPAAEPDLQTAFFLPETILAVPRDPFDTAPARHAAVTPPASADRAPAAESAPTADIASSAEPAAECRPVEESAPAPEVSAPAIPTAGAEAAVATMASVTTATRDAADDAADDAALDYFSPRRRGPGFVARHGALSLSLVVLLALLLALQWGYAQRATIAARFPALAPAMTALLAPLGASIGLPRDLQSLTIESFELQASPTPGVLALSALLRNRAGHAVEWPSMELTLTDPANRVLARKVIGPGEYLPAAADAGVPPRAEWPLRLALEAREVEAAGYSVILFYP